jgi:hypothetical protein
MNKELEECMQEEMKLVSKHEKSSTTLSLKQKQTYIK